MLLEMFQPTTNRHYYMIFYYLQNSLQFRTAVTMAILEIVDDAFW